MTSSTRAQAAFEVYLLAMMRRLCGHSTNLSDGDLVGYRLIAELGLFDIDTRFSKVAGTLGPGLAAAPQVIEDAPESFRESVEHRYALSRWPDFEFRILESRGGFAWGQMFVRRSGVAPPPIARVEDLRAWSHVESEVQVALGEPVSSEEWSPWKAVTYRTDTALYGLCYVYGLLQRVEVVDERKHG